MSQNRIHAPELPDSLQWINTDAPVRLAEQRGKVVLLDFWTYCCINCMHILPDLRYLEQKYPESLTVIGVHSPKHPNERVDEHVRKAVNRYHIRHPVANDPKFQVWRQYGVRAWPTVVFIDPEGYVVGALSGEGRRRQLDQLIAQHLEAAERKGIRRESPLPVKARPEPREVLSFPGKVYATRDRVYLSDSGHNRVLELRPNGTVVRTFGSGSAGLVDGEELESCFNDPQGLVREGESLYVADTGNHALRRIDLLHGYVQTVAGTGEQGRYVGDRFDDPLRAALNSPWDLAHHDGIVYVAMAGQHQIWGLDLRRASLAVVAGSGREELADGPAREAGLAQPSGLAMGDGVLYIADSETSAVRVLDLERRQLGRLVGSGLFDFGDVDGPASEARLQHALGLSFDSARQVLWIADTYNHKIKKLELSSKVVSTLTISHPLAEPGGISLWEDQLWVANTNAHELVRVDLSSGAAEVVPVAQ